MRLINTKMAVPSSRVLVYGGRGALGSTIVSYFKTKDWWVASIDLVSNDQANESIVIEPCESWVKQDEDVQLKVSQALNGEKVDAILCVAGGWAGGNAASEDMVKNADMMWKQSVWTSTIAARLAALHLKEGGTLTLTGAQPALSGTPGMMGYGMAKAAVHQLVQSLAGKKSGLPEDAFVAAILPITLNTPMNRKFMPKADQSKWTPLETVAGLFFDWTQNKDRPSNGSLVQLVTKDGKTEQITA